MSVSGVLGAPNPDLLSQGKHGYLRIYTCEATVAAPVSATILYGVQNWEIGTPDVNVDTKHFHIGGSDEYTRKRFGFTYPWSLTMEDGYAFQEVEKFYNRTFASDGDSFIPFDPLAAEYPQFIFEAIKRRDDADTHIGSIIAPDIIIDPMSFSQGLEDNTFTITGYTKRTVGILAAGVELVYDEFTGDGSTTEFTLSSTPLTLTTASLYPNLDYNNLIYVKEKASGATSGTIQKSGYSATGTTLTATTAPAASTTVQVLYTKATA